MTRSGSGMGEQDVSAEARAILESLAMTRPVSRQRMRDAVRRTLKVLVESAPGHSVEIRVPPFAAVQAIPGLTHRRGTPPALVETDAATWLALAIGEVSWGDAVAAGRVRASGARSDLTPYLPLDL